MYCIEVWNFEVEMGLQMEEDNGIIIIYYTSEKT